MIGERRYHEAIPKLESLLQAESDLIRSNAARTLGDIGDKTTVPALQRALDLLALMASGLEGQRFRFAGYLPVAAPERAAAIRELESRPAAGRETQVFIETPSRNDALLAEVLRTCREDTHLAVATELTGAAERIRSASVGEWRARPAPPGKRPAIFLLLAAARAAKR